MSVDLIKLARVIEATADHLEAIENEKLSSVRAERQTQIDKLASAYSEATGEELPTTVRHKLAASDQDVVALINSMVEKQAARIEPLGRASDQVEDKEPASVKEAAAQAEDRFLSWIMS